jgi:MoaA/NifB/PqqE/SkfB family radical SAM enzyme
MVVGLRYRAFEPPRELPVPPDVIRSDHLDDRFPHIGGRAGLLDGHRHPWFFVYSCNLSIVRDEHVWFDEDFVGWGMEDIELAYRLHQRGHQVFVHPDANVLHIEANAPHDPFRCEERGLPRNYDSYVRNAVMLLDRHPHDPELARVIRNDIRWYVWNRHTCNWEKNGHENNPDRVIEAVRAELRGRVPRPATSGKPRKSRPTPALSASKRPAVQKLRPAGQPIGGDPLSWALHEIAIELTTWCNLKCTMCSVWEGKKLGVSHKLARELLASAFRLGARSFVPCGAESFMRKDFIDLLTFADELGYAQQEIVTNGILVPYHLEALAQIPSVRLHISIDGPEPVHDALRGGGNYQRALAAARSAAERGISVGLSGVLMRPTMETARHIVDLAVELRLGEVSFQPFQPEIHGVGRDASPWLFGPEERAHVQKALAELQAYAGKRGVKIFTESLFPEIVPYLFDGIRPIPPGGCYMPSRFALIDVHGDVYPCFFMRDLAIGNVMRGDRLEDLWHGHIHEKLQKVAITGRCPGCLAACSDIASYDGARRTATTDRDGRLAS